jgi:hypothetical protein
MQNQAAFSGASTGGPIAQTGYLDPNQQYQVTGGNISAPMTSNPQLAMQQQMATQQRMTGVSPIQSQKMFAGAPTGGGGALGGLAQPMFLQSQPMFSGTPGGGGALGQIASPGQIASLGQLASGIQSQQAFAGTPMGGGGQFGEVAAQSAQNPQAFAQQYGSPMQSQQAFTGTPMGGGGALGGLAAPSTQAAAPQRMAAMLRAVRPSRY